ncbi:hypothetical protein BC832DRAFT_592656 [Gaertneriomyces semiglobifer]|nr:hypothetical protein BC832DRAFT_592656 [Gaertneriomyces semiglobifer]
MVQMCVPRSSASRSGLCLTSKVLAAVDETVAQAAEECDKHTQSPNHRIAKASNIADKSTTDISPLEVFEVVQKINAFVSASRQLAHEEQHLQPNLKSREDYIMATISPLREQLEALKKDLEIAEEFGLRINERLKGSR